MIGTAPIDWFVCMRIFGDALDFERISETLHVSASKAWRAGDRLLSGRAVPMDVWILDSPLAHTEPVDVHLAWFRRELLPHYGFLRSLKGTAEISSYCGLSVDSDRCSFRISGEALRIFKELNISMEFGLVFTGYPDSTTERSEPKPSECEAEKPEFVPGTYRTESEVAFEVVGAGLDLSSISSQLGFDPSKAHHLGETDSAGDQHPSDSWSLVAPLPRTDALDGHLKWLGMSLLPHASFLRSLKYKAELLVRCNFGTESDSGGLGVSPEGMRVCTDLDIPLELNAFLI